jgi:hypothetical protein
VNVACAPTCFISSSELCHITLMENNTLKCLVATLVPEISYRLAIPCNADTNTKCTILLRVDGNNAESNLAAAWRLRARSCGRGTIVHVPRQREPLFVQTLQETGTVDEARLLCFPTLCGTILYEYSTVRRYQTCIVVRACICWGAALDCHTFDRYLRPCILKTGSKSEID